MTTTEFAKALGLSGRSITRACRDGALPAVRLPRGQWRIDLDAMRDGKSEWRAIYAMIAK